MEEDLDVAGRGAFDDEVGTLDPTRVVRGQYEGYRDEDGVAGGSDVATYVALEISIGSWRWAGVPFDIRAGKGLPITATEVVVEFRRRPLQFVARGDAPHRTPTTSGS